VYAPEQASTASGLRRSMALRTLEVGPDYEKLIAESSFEPLAEPVELDETCMILYTSGTTGKPKGAMLTHGNIAWNSFNLLLDVDLASDEVTLVAAPMFHVAALNQTALPTLLKGGRLVLMSAFDPDEALRLIARHRVTYFFGVPTMFPAMTRSPGWAEADLSSLRSAICGGAPVAEAVVIPYQDR